MPSADHATHDRTLIAAMSTRDPDMTPAETANAEAMLAACTECARLRDDLRALAAALPSASTPRRTREFTLTPADAERLRPRGLRRWLGLVGTSRDSITRPLALGFTTLGIAGLLVATVPAVLPMAGSGAAQLSPEGAGAASAAPAAAPGGSTDALAMSAEPSPVDNGEVFNGTDTDDPAPGATRNAGDTAALQEATDVRDDGSGLSTLLVIAGTLLIVGLGLFALRWSARRLE